MKAKRLLIATLLVLGLFSLLFILNQNFSTQIPGEIFQILKWVALGLATWFAIEKQNLTAWILVAMFMGIALGSDFPEISKPLKVLSDIFLRLIKTIIAPLLFSTLVVGIAGHSNIKQVGRMGLKSIFYFEIVTTVALFIGLASINLTKAGVGSNMEAQNSQIEKANTMLAQKQSHDVILDIFPENIAKSIVDNQILQIVVFSILFGIGLALVKNEEKKAAILLFSEGLSEVMFKFTHIVMLFAPFAVGGAMAYSVANMGLGVIGNLLKLVGTLYGALFAFVALVLVPIGFMVKLPFKRFLNAISEPVSIAFATASSEAALPKAMENLEGMGIPRKVVAFVLPTGYSFNLDGTTLYLSLASVFIAQASGMDLSLGQQIQMCLILMLTSKGVAGVRGASFLILVSTVSSLGLDPTKAFAILAVDALMDMGRTTVNVIGNCLATYVVAKWEGEV
ncbi:MAG: cation:dicarboxylase symporter family transporter [Bacteroidia bacterium]|nr:cation:dicarboxylase symporter family transporter [Bacteroidia bacterium]MCF8426339.1 cation:dicarboxylase symporter family transporter [Bacteroidia bacterium]MCF8445762.1 cation:dicarboxylase symporter family transporter [Bacteroidia bacterium]